MLVGFGQASITPRGGKIAVAGSIPPRLTDLVHDDIQAVAMIIGEGASRVVWVSCDICHPTQILTNEVADRLMEVLPQFHKDQLIISATHSSACTRLAEDFLTVSELPPDDQALPLELAREHVRNGIVNAIVTANNSMCECSISYAKADIITGLCRRVVYKDGTAVMYGKTDREDFLRMEYPDSGPTQILYFSSLKDNALVGIFAAVPCPAQADESSGYITGDYWNVVRNRVHSKLSSDVTVFGVCSSAGELAPKRLLGTHHSIINGPARAAELGTQIADSLIQLQHHPLKVYTPDELTFHNLAQQVVFPVRQTDEVSFLNAERYFADPTNFDENGSPRRMIHFALHKYIDRLWKSGKTTHISQINAIIIADLLFFTAPAELFSEYGKRIRSCFPGYAVFDIQLSNDNMGYLPTREAIEHGGYSTLAFNTLTDADGGELLVDTVKDMFYKLIKEK